MKVTAVRSLVCTWPLITAAVLNWAKSRCPFLLDSAVRSERTGDAVELAHRELASSHSRSSVEIVPDFTSSSRLRVHSGRRRKQGTQGNVLNGKSCVFQEKSELWIGSFFIS